MEAKLKAAINLLKKDPEYQSYFFKKLGRIDLFFSLEKENFFSCKYNPDPIPSDDNKNYFTIPYWQALTYLEKVSKEAAKPENLDYALALMQILRDVTMPGGKPGERVDNYRTWYMFAKIMSNLPSEVIKQEDVDLIEYWLDSKFDNGLVAHEIARNILPKFLESGQPEDIEKAIRIIEIATCPKSEGKILMDADDLERFFKKNATLLGQRKGRKMLSILQSRLEDDNILSKKDDDYGYVWRSAIEDHEQNTSIHEPRHVLISGLRDALLAYVQPGRHKKVLSALWQGSRFVLKRIAIFVLNQKFDKKQCEKFLTENVLDIFLEPNYHHEVFELIRARFQQLSIKTQDAIIQIINNLTREWREGISQQERDEFTTHLRRRWLYAIQLSGYELSDDLVNKYDLEKYGPEHPEFLSYHGPVTWGVEQLFSVADLMENRQVKDVVEFLNSFKDKNRFNEVGYEEAGQVLKQAVKTNQTIFENDLMEFLSAKHIYQYYVLQAYEEIWNEKKPVEWGKILEFCKAVLDLQGLWDKKDTPRAIGFHFRKDWTPSLIARFIQSAVREDEWAMPDECLSDARDILENLLVKVEPSVKGDESDALTEAINSTKGHAIEAYINFALRKCRILTGENDNKGVKQRAEFWKEIEPIFDKELEKSKNTNFEFSALAGRYLPNFYYLSERWTQSNINRIFSTDKEYEKNWRCTITGYSYVNKVYPVIYNLLKDNGHFMRVLDSSFENRNIRERIIENIGISYLRGQEPFEGEGSLFAEVLKRWKSEDICDLIDLFWIHREEDFQNQEKERILDFWEYCYKKVNGSELAYKDILSDLNLLAVFFKQIDENGKEWLMQSAPYVEHRHHSYFFLQILNRLADVNPKEIGEICIEMIKNDVAPRYEEENIHSIVEKIYKSGELSLANQICDGYKPDNDFLRDLHDRYN